MRSEFDDTTIIVRSGRDAFPGGGLQPLPRRSDFGPSG